VNDAIREIAAHLREARHAVAFTGAGVSTDSGIPDFRSVASGLWRDIDPMKVASLEGFTREPRAFYEFWGDRFAGLRNAEPNIAHRALAALERAALLRIVITQNIDGLHTLAGSARVLEIHGSYRRSRCIECGASGDLQAVVERVRAGRLPVCQRCGGLEKPDVVLFGEELPPVFSLAQNEVRRADLLLVCGSSLEVHPAASLVPDASARGAFVAIINRDEGAYDDLADVALRSDLDPAMRALTSELGIQL
jgi:NAD-dependent deacetylase